MGVYDQALAGAVALQTDIRVGVARLTRGQTASCLSGVGIGPIVGQQDRAGVAVIALVVGHYGVRPGSRFEISPPPAM